MCPVGSHQSEAHVSGWNYDLHTGRFGYCKEEACKLCESGTFEFDVLFDHACKCLAVVVLRELSVSPEVIWIPINGSVPV